MSSRKNISSGAKWESVVGYSRAVRIGNVIEVSGTVAVEGEEVMFPGDPYNQARYIILKIEQALKDAGASLKEVVRTRIYVLDISMWEEIGRAHGEFFAEIMPATTMIEVLGLIQDELLLEIEATAIIES